MNVFLPLTLAAALGASVALAQSAQSQGNPAVKDPQPITNVQLEPGANSFTEGQARSRLEDAGFKDVADLKKDDQGIWRAKAQKDGRSVNVGLDYKGNIGAQ